jgi:hypothetical protein
LLARIYHWPPGEIEAMDLDQVSFWLAANAALNERLKGA